MPPTLFELGAVPIPRKERGEGNGDVKKRVVNDLVLDEEGKAYPLAWDVVKGTPAIINWEPRDVLDYIGLRQYLDAERFNGLPVKGRDFRINTKEVIGLTAQGAFNLLECSWGPL